MTEEEIDELRYDDVKKQPLLARYEEQFKMDYTPV